MAYSLEQSVVALLFDDMSPVSKRRDAVGIGVKYKGDLSMFRYTRPE